LDRNDIGREGLEGTEKSSHGGHGGTEEPHLIVRARRGRRREYPLNGFDFNDEFLFDYKVDLEGAREDDVTVLHGRDDLFLEAEAGLATVCG
jgi:hypothetical protein